MFPAENQISPFTEVIDARLNLVFFFKEVDSFSQGRHHVISSIGLETGSFLRWCGAVRLLRSKVEALSPSKCWALNKGGISVWKHFPCVKKELYYFH